MNKSMLVIETPESCEKCQLCVNVLGKHYCAAKGTHIAKGERDCSCPLVAVPTVEAVLDTNVGKWIPCSERLPDKEYELYWTTHEDGSIVLHGYTKKNGFIYNWEVDDLELRKRQGGVVAWMLIPQPEPYKGE